MHNLANDQIMISCSTVTCGIKLALHDLYIYAKQKQPGVVKKGRGQAK